MFNKRQLKAEEVKVPPVETKNLRVNPFPKIKITKEEKENEKIKKIIKILNSRENPNNFRRKVNVNAAMVLKNGGGVA